MNNFDKILNSTNTTLNTSLSRVSYLLINNITGFIQFLLVDNNIIKVCIALITATQINSLTGIIVDNIITPIVYRIISLVTQTKEDNKALQDKTFTYLGIKFKIGALLIGLIKFAIILIIIYQISTLSLRENTSKIIDNLKNLKKELKIKMQ